MRRHLAHTMIFLSILAMLLISFGAYGLFPSGNAFGRAERYSSQVRDHHLHHRVEHQHHRTWACVTLSRTSCNAQTNAAAGSEDQVLLEETALVGTHHV